MSEQLRRVVYVWQVPVRCFHWINFLCLLSLTVTGFLIADPPALQSASPAWFSYWFGWVRFIHFASAYLFVLNLVYRIYWSVAGNGYARWSNFIPLRPAQWREMWEVGKHYGLIFRHQAPKSIGHNSMAATSYLGLFAISLFQVVTGFGMYAPMSGSWFPGLFAWIVPLFGSDMAVRQWHHLMTWVFIVFTLVHIYLVYFNDVRERQGVFSSIFTGFKFVEKE